jgi:hypothetical protein
VSADTILLPPAVSSSYCERRRRRCDDDDDGVVAGSTQDSIMPSAIGPSADADNNVWGASSRIVVSSSISTSIIRPSPLTCSSLDIVVVVVVVVFLCPGRPTMSVSDSPLLLANTATNDASRST